jgi:hypothetical protein
MKTSVAITIITVGGLLVIAPIASLQWQVERAANHYEQYGGGSTLPEELRPKPPSRYDWASLAVGTVLALTGVAGSMRACPFCLSLPQQYCRQG